MIAHRAPRVVASPLRDVEVHGVGTDSFSDVGIALDLWSTVTGPCLDYGKCNGCVVRTNDAVEQRLPAFSCASQILAKTAIMVAAGAGGWFYGGWLYGLAGALAGNIVARPIVNAIATASGPAPDTTGVK